MLTDLLLLLLILFQRPQCECYTDQGLEGGILPGCATRQGVPSFRKLSEPCPVQFYGGFTADL